MTLFSSDLFRNFAFGFVAGGLLVSAATLDDWTDMVEAPANAAAPIEAPHETLALDNDFVITPIEKDL